MKKVVIGVLAGIIFLGFLATAVAIVKAQDKGKANAPDLEKIEFIHWKKGYGKPEWAKAPKPPSCYKFLTPTKVKWAIPPAVSYVINPANPQELSADFVGAAVSTSAETWDEATTQELTNDVYKFGEVAYGVQDYINAIAFGDYPTEGVIAVTTVWYNPATKKIVEFDVMFDTDWTWGDAIADSSKMDLQNIATHEFGHGVGLNDVYQTDCSLVTMYGYSDYGETQKRTLEPPDINGLLTLYP